MKFSARLLPGPILLCVALAGCHGGTSGIVPLATPQGTKSASFSIFVPAAAPGIATPRSFVVALLSANGTPVGKATPVTVDLTAQSRACKPLAGGALSCTATVTAPIGNDTFSLTTFAGAGGSGKQLATQQTKTVVGGRGLKCVKPAAPASQPVGGRSR